MAVSRPALATAVVAASRKTTSKHSFLALTKIAYSITDMNHIQ
jgi:hypothetical protein